MKDLKKIAMVSVGVTGITAGLAWLYNKYLPDGIASLSFSAIDIPVRQQIKAGIDTTLAGKLLGYLGGVIPQEGVFGMLITLFVASFLVVLLGSLVSENITIGKTETAKFAVSMTIAAGLIGVGLGYFSPSIGYLGTALAMLIYFGIVSLIYFLAGKIQAFQQVFPAL